MPTALRTRVTELLGIRFPIVLGGMAYVSNSRLVAAVTEAGGLGVLGSAPMSPDELASSVDEVRTLTDKPFGANLSLIVKSNDEEVEVLIDRKVPVVVTSGGSPRRHTARLKAGGCKVLHVGTSARFAEKAEAAGVDAMVLQGIEAGGHLGRDEMPLSVMIPLARSKVSIPILAAGGIVCGHGMAAALALGADGVQIGTRFAASDESPAHERWKQMVLAAEEQDPVVYGRLENPARSLRTPAVERLCHLDRTGATPEEIDRARGLGRVGLALLEGDEREGIFPCGLGAARINQIRPAAELIDRMIEQYLGAVEGLPRE